MITRTIVTSLVDKEEVFRVLALAEATGYPVLLVGPPGVGKTNCMIDYAKSELKTKADMDKVFILETDELTKPSEIKGQIDIQALAIDKRWAKIRPIANAEFIMINEIDKANSGCRNAMLSIMNEKRIFDGSEVVPLNYKMFVASCNEIPGDEMGSPFWDRFAIRFNVTRTGAENLIRYIMGQGATQEITINIPNKEDLANIQLSPDKMNVFVTTVYSELSDRALTRLGSMVKAAMVVYECNEVDGILKVASLIAPAHVDSLSKKLEDKVVVRLKSIVEQLPRIIDEAVAYKTLSDLQLVLSEIVRKRNFTKEEKVRYARLAVQTIDNSNEVIRKTWQQLKEEDGVSEEQPEPETTTAE